MGHEIIIRIGCHRYYRFIKEIVIWKWISLMISVNEVYFATKLYVHVYCVKVHVSIILCRGGVMELCMHAQLHMTDDCIRAFLWSPIQEMDP